MITICTRIQFHVLHCCDQDFCHGQCEQPRRVNEVSIDHSRWCGCSSSGSGSGVRIDHMGVCIGTRIPNSGRGM